MAKQKLQIALKRVYDEPEPSDGIRILVDRLWPRGLSKERAHLDLWQKEIAPSNELRKWFGHDPEKFAEFRRRYEAELASEAGQEALAKLRDMAKRELVTLVFAAQNTAHNNAVVLRDLLLSGTFGRLANGIPERVGNAGKAIDGKGLEGQQHDGSHE